MQHAILIVTLAIGILAAPLLCDAGVTAHECVCDSTECCGDEVTCEPDPCGDVFGGIRQVHEPTSDIVTASFSTGIEALSSSEPLPTALIQDTGGNRPFPDSDVPLRI